MRVHIDPLLVMILAAACQASASAQEPGTGTAAVSQHLAQAPETTSDAQASPRAVENADVIAMIQEMSDDAVLKVIEEHVCHFDLSADGLIALKKAGVSDRVLLGMLDASRPPASNNHALDTPAAAAAAPPDDRAGSAAGSGVTAAPATGAGAPVSPNGAGMSMPGMPAMDPKSAAVLQNALSQLQAMGLGGLAPGLMGRSAPVASLPHVAVRTGTERVELPPAIALRAISTFKGGGSDAGRAALNALALEPLSFAGAADLSPNAGRAAFPTMGAGFFGSRARPPSITYAWGLPGAHAAHTLPESGTTFELLYKDLPGLEPEALEPVLVRLAPTRDNFRLVGATRQGGGDRVMTTGGGNNGQWVVEQRMPVRVVSRGKGDCTLQATDPLPAGEYAVVFRPAKQHKASGADLLAGAQLNAAVWDFSVPAGAAPPAPLH